MDFRRRNYGRNHAYFLDGEKLPGVTTIMSTAMPPFLAKYAAECAADVVMDDPAWFMGLHSSEKYRRMVEAYNVRSREAAARGTRIHELAVPLITGVDVDTPVELVGPMEALADTMDRLGMVPVLRELPVFNVEHRYAGTFDLLAEIDGVTWLLDFKSGKGPYDSWALQLAAYNHATHYQTEGDTIAEWVPAERCGAVHITADSATLYPVDAGEDTFDAFLSCLPVYEWSGRVKAARESGVPWPVHEAFLPPVEVDA